MGSYIKNDYNLLLKDEIKEILNSRRHDSNINVRLTVIDIIKDSIFQIKDNEKKFKYLIEFLVERVSDINSKVRGNVLDCLYQINEKNPSFLTDNFEILVTIPNQLYDVEEISNFSAKLLLKFLFQSYEEINNKKKTIKKSKKTIENSIVSNRISVLIKIVNKLNSADWFLKLIEFLDVENKVILKNIFIVILFNKLNNTYFL